MSFQALTKWAADRRSSRVPRPVLARAARVLVDDFAALASACGEPELERYYASLPERAAGATVFATRPRRTDPDRAAIANTIGMVWTELEEGYRKTSCHAGLYILPVLMAEAEARPMATGDLLERVAIAYELVVRLARAWQFPALADQGRQWVHARFGAPGAAGALALARGFDARRLADAIASAAALTTTGPRRHATRGALAWNAWAGAGAANGILAVDWAQSGMCTLDSTLDDAFGTECGGVCDSSELTRDLGTDWAIMDGFTKLYACIQHAHSAVEAALDIQVRAEEIECVDVAVHALALVLDNMHPATTLGSRFSLQHCVAAALVLGDGGAGAFSAAALDNPSIRALRERIRIGRFERTLPPPNDRPARITVTLAGGRTLVAECLSARGGPDRPFTASEVLDKVRALTAPHYPAFGTLAERLLELDAATLAAPWSDHVRAFTPSRPA